MEEKNLIEWALETIVDIPVHVNDKTAILKAGSLFIYDPNQNFYIHVFGDDIPEIKGVTARIYLYRGWKLDMTGDSVYSNWLKKNFKQVPCPPELQIKKKLYNFILQNLYSTYNKFKGDDWPRVGGDISRKFFKFGEKAVFVQDFPAERVGMVRSLQKTNESNGYTFFTGGTKYLMGEEYPTLGSTEVKVLLIDDEGKLDLIPFFAVQNTGKTAHWFKFTWWLKIYLESKGIIKSHGRFASNLSAYADKPKKIDSNPKNVVGSPKKIDSSSGREFYIGELLKLTQSFPLDGTDVTYKAGEVYPTLGLYRGKGDNLPFFDINANKVLQSGGVSYTEPRALIVNSLGQLDLIPLNYVISTGNYDIIFAIEYYIRILYSRLFKK